MRILLIEDSALAQRALTHLIRDLRPGARVDVVDNAPEAITHLDTFAYDYIVSDFDLRIGTGGDVLQHVREHFGFYVDGNRFLLMTGDLRQDIRDLGHPLTYEKLFMTDQLRRLLSSHQSSHAPQ